MSKTYTKREIAYNLSCSVQTVEDDAAYLNIVPSKPNGNRNYYSEKDFSLISQLRFHCAGGQNTRESFVPKYEPEIVTQDKITRIKPNQLDRFSQTLEFGLAQDPLFELEVLQRIKNNNWLLPTDKIAALLNLSPGYLSSLDFYIYCGFVAIKELKTNNKNMWRVE